MMRSKTPPDPKARALEVYAGEVDQPKNLDFGAKSVSRAKLRVLLTDVILDGAKIAKKSYSQSHLSSAAGTSVYNEDDDATHKLRKLIKERLVVVRMGFVERANTLDAEIEELRKEAAHERAVREKSLVDRAMVELEKKLSVRHARLLHELGVEKKHLEEQLDKEYNRMKLAQSQEFNRIIENAQRRAMGKVRKCNCGYSHLCRHNKTASYNTRKPVKEVLLWRNNSRRLKKGGRAEDAALWEEKANELDYKQAEGFRMRAAKAVVSSPWGATEASVDKLIDKHKKDTELTKRMQRMRREVLEEKQRRRVTAFDNLAVAERARTRAFAKKEYDMETQLREEEERAFQHRRAEGAAAQSTAIDFDGLRREAGEDGGGGGPVMYSALDDEDYDGAFDASYSNSPPVQQFAPSPPDSSRKPTTSFSRGGTSLVSPDRRE